MVPDPQPDEGLALTRTLTRTLTLTQTRNPIKAAGTGSNPHALLGMSRPTTVLTPPAEDFVLQFRNQETFTGKHLEPGPDE